MKLLVRCGFDSCDSCDHFQCDAHFDIATDQQLFKSSEAIRGGPQGMVQAETEHKATITVTAIVTCFTITQSPSAFVTFLSFYIYYLFLVHNECNLHNPRRPGKSIELCTFLSIFCLILTTFYGTRNSNEIDEENVICRNRG
ncbi:hypothetical protein L3Y34_002139 [Caenorhabditis briggsae]|uniref:Uncharacterized protein n=1 Tax=Caenorhabditis briggsae TaxID=6238 RepID=A0AAE9DFF4_CAEBR|nr:hypothetical protein L3Y34_002139 [Caenorhabditis briggsae]